MTAPAPGEAFLIDPRILPVAKRLAWQTRPVHVDATGWDEERFWPLLTDMQQRGHIFRARIAIERIDELYEQSPKMAAE